jgi:capsular polysaccharide transport system permease protein
MSTRTSSRLRSGALVQLRVLHALMIRELITRFGRDNIGFLWIMVEPLLFAVLVAIIWHYLHGETMHGVGVTAFIVSGYIPLTLFRHVVARSVAVFTANGSLLYHRQVKIFDFILVRFFIELIGGMMAYFFIGCILIIIGDFPIPDNIGLLIGGWFVYSFFCFSLCLIIAPLSEMSEVLEKFVPVTTYVMIPFSGLFTMASWLTPEMRSYFLYSPFVNGMEMMRKGIWGEQVTAYYDPWYTIWLSLALTLVGLTLCRIVRRKLTVD